MTELDQLQLLLDVIIYTFRAVAIDVLFLCNVIVIYKKWPNYNYILLPTASQISNKCSNKTGVTHSK